jgi:hypothetical protein
MTYPDPRLEGPVEPPQAPQENVQDIVPPSERGQDPQRSTNALVTEVERPLTDEERKAADRDVAPGERVYAPASERVPKIVEGHRDVIEHPDNATPERQAAATEATTTTTGWTPPADPSFTRVARPSEDGGPQYDATQDDWSSPQGNRWMSNVSGANAVPFGIGWLSLAVCGGVGVWLWMRWQRERNKPMNRLRRQARQTASVARARAEALYEQMPDLPEFPDEARRPAVGLGTALLSLAIVLWQQSQARQRSDVRHQARSKVDKASRQANKAGRRAAESLSDIDWQDRLMQLRGMWNPGRIELEKVSIPKR